METRLPASEIDGVHRALQRRHPYEQLSALAEVLLWRNNAVNDQLDMFDGPTEQPNTSQVVLETIMLLDMEVTNGGLFQFIWNCPGWLDHVAPSLRYIGLPMLADLFEHSTSDIVARIGTFAEFRKKDSLEAYSECAGEFSFDEFDSAYFQHEGVVHANSVAFVSERLSDFVA